MKRKEGLFFVQGFKELEQLSGFSFVLALTRNFQLIQNELELLEKAKTKNPGFEKYAKAHQQLLEKHSKKSSDGMPITNVNSIGLTYYQIPTESQPIFQTEMKVLEKEFSDVLEKQKQIDAEFEEELEKELDLPLKRITEKILPKNINSRQLNLIYPMIDFDELYP